MCRLLPDVLSIMPHDPPMALLGRLVDAGPNFLEAEADIGPDHLFFRPPDGVPAYLALELMAQAVGAHSGYGSWLGGEEAKLGLLLGTRNLQLARPWFAKGELLTIRVEKVFQDLQLGAYEGVVTVGGEERATAVLNVYQPENEREAVARMTGGNP